MYYMYIHLSRSLHLEPLQFVSHVSLRLDEDYPIRASSFHSSGAESTITLQYSLSVSYCYIQCLAHHDLKL